jgi:hypothetical protein
MRLIIAEPYLPGTPQRSLRRFKKVHRNIKPRS